jgi:LPS sulfotransferase NodH
MFHPGDPRIMNQELLSRVFLVGCPRSGTTLLQSLLAANSCILSFPESHFYEDLFSGWPLLSALGISSRHARPRWNVFLEKIGHPEMNSILPKHAIFDRQLSGAFVEVLDTLTMKQGKPVWLEKTPGHLRCVDQIEKLVRNARFVHILRSGEDNIASLVAVGNKYPEPWGRWYGTLDRCIQR